MIKKNLRVFLLCSSVFLIAVVFLVFHFNEDEVRCQGKTYTADDGNILRAQISLVLSQGSGNGVYEGEYTNKQGKVSHIRHSVQFSYQNRGDLYQFRNSTSTPLLANNLGGSDMKENIPYYFIDPGASITLRMTRVGAKSYLFTNAYMPIFYCQG